MLFLLNRIIKVRFNYIIRKKIEVKTINCEDIPI